MESTQDPLIYGRDDRPPWGVLVLLACQHIVLMSSTLILPVALVKEIGGSNLEAAAVVSLTMISAGIGTILQAIRRGPVGSGYLCPNLCGPSFFGVSMQAAWIGGLPLMWGMTLFAGLCEAAFSRIVRYLRVLFPLEVTGLVVILVAVSLVPLGASKFVGIDYAGDPISPGGLVVAVITLATMMGVNVWGKGHFRLYNVLMGMAVGYVMSIALNLVGASELHEVARQPWFALPRPGRSLLELKFDASLVLPFLIVSICGALKSFGNLITCQRINDPDSTEPDMKNVSRGLLADSLSLMTAGVLGGMATDTSASNVGLSSATGATSRSIAWVAGLLFILLAFLPKLSALLVIMPRPVMGAILVFVTCFMLMAGFRIIGSAEPDTRTTFVIGVSFVFALSLDILPQLYADVPVWIQPVFTSSLTLGTVLAVILNLILRFRRSQEADRG